jgi:hypothetical protein
MTGVRSPTEAEDFSSSLCGSGAHPASCAMVTRGPFPRVKRGQGVMLTTHPHLVPRLSMSRSYTSSSPHTPPWRIAGQIYFCFTKFSLKQVISYMLSKKLGNKLCYPIFIPRYRALLSSNTDTRERGSRGGASPCTSSCTFSASSVYQYRTLIMKDETEP